MDNAAIKQLAEAVIKQASADYLYFYTTKAKHINGTWGLNETKRHHEEAKIFFNSEYCELLTGYQGTIILNRLNRLVKNGKAKEAFKEARKGI